MSKYDRFVAGFAALMADIGAVRFECGLHEWYVETEAGRLGVTPRRFTSPKIGVAIVFCRFQEPDRAKPLVGLQSDGGRLNPYSGKWNFYYDSAWLPSEALADFERHLRKVL